jgi:dihydroflavonol-4-reductase
VERAAVPAERQLDERAGRVADGRDVDRESADIRPAGVLCIVAPMKTVLVTGATGNVGHRIATKLRDRGDRVRALVRDPERARKVLPDVELVRGDVTAPETLEPAMRDVGLVFHAAGMPEQWQRDEGIFDRVNHAGTVAVFDAAKAAKVDRVVYTSTMDVFAAPRGGTLVETNLDDGPKPSAYETSKVAADRAFVKAVAGGLDAVSINPSAVYGPSPSNVGLNALFIKLAKKKAPMLPPGGMSVVYVDGVADAHLAAAERGKKGERYLVADAYLSLREIAEVVARLRDLGRVPPYGPAWLLHAMAAVLAPLARTFRFQPLATSGELHFVLWQARVDASKAKKELGFEPMPFEEGAKKTLEHLVACGAIEAL